MQTATVVFSNLLFVRRLFDVVLVFLAQFDLHFSVELYQFLLVRLQLCQKIAQMFMKLHFTCNLSINTTLPTHNVTVLQCFDTVGWAPGKH